MPIQGELLTGHGQNLSVFGPVAVDCVGFPPNIRLPLFLANGTLSFLLGSSPLESELIPKSVENPESS